MTIQTPAPEFTAAVRDLMARRALDDSRAAALLGVPVPTIRKWIAGTRAPSAAAVRLLEILGTLEAIAPALFDSFLPAPAVAVKKQKTGRPRKTKID
jgi:hypothetical protein